MSSLREADHLYLIEDSMPILPSQRKDLLISAHLLAPKVFFQSIQVNIVPGMQRKILWNYKIYLKCAYIYIYSQNWELDIRLGVWIAPKYNWCLVNPQLANGQMIQLKSSCSQTSKTVFCGLKKNIILRIAFLWPSFRLCLCWQIIKGEMHSLPSVNIISHSISW